MVVFNQQNISMATKPAHVLRPQFLECLRFYCCSGILKTLLFLQVLPLILQIYFEVSTHLLLAYFCGSLILNSAQHLIKYGI